MSAAAPQLLRRLLEQAGGASETSYVLVLEGEGLEELPASIETPRGAYSVHRVTTELGLRHLVWRAKGAPFIAVMAPQVAERIQRAPDLLRRAHKQRVHAMSVSDVLEVLLGVRVLGADDPDLGKLALENVEQLAQELGSRTLPTVIDRKLLTELLLDLSVGEQVRTSAPAKLLAAWVQQLPSWSSSEKKLLREALPTLHGDEGRLLGWALHTPETRLSQLLVYGALLAVDAPEISNGAWGPLLVLDTAVDFADMRPVLRETIARLARDTFALLGDDANGLLDQADAVAHKALLRPQIETSLLLPLAFKARCHSLAKQAASGKPISRAEMHWLSQHHAARRHPAELAVLEAMARLSRYVAQPDTLAADLVEQVRDYQHSGAFVDLAMTQLRRSLASSVVHLAEAKKLLATCRERREQQNLRFARSLAGNYESALHSRGLTPLHRVWKNIVAPVWNDDPSARLLMVVLDGCSYPVFLELLYALSQDSALPVGISPDAQGHVRGLPALSPLPTVTSHARGAIFLGELPQDPLVAETVFHDQEEAKTDRARFKQNAALGSRTRKLFLKGDLLDHGQALHAAIDDTNIEIVAVVFNAVDDQIGSSNTGATVRLRPEDITAFKPAIHNALRQGRRVLITADHGHSPFLDKSLRVDAGSAPRYLPLAKGQKAPEGFLEIDLASLGGPPERRAFAWSSGVYLGNQQVGFHGGCSLEEMVVPLAWLSPHGLHADEPAWWFGTSVAGDAPARKAARPSPKQQREPAPAPTAPVVVHTPASKAPAVTAPAPAAAVTAPAPAAAVTAPAPVVESASPQIAFFASAASTVLLPLPAELLAALSGDEKNVLLLLRDTGEARASELAKHINKNPGRLNGLMLGLRRQLHRAGHVLFTDVQLPDGDTVYRYQSKAGQ